MVILPFLIIVKQFLFSLTWTSRYTDFVTIPLNINFFSFFHTRSRQPSNLMAYHIFPTHCLSFLRLFSFNTIRRSVYIKIIDQRIRSFGFDYFFFSQHCFEQAAPIITMGPIITDLIFDVSYGSNFSRARYKGESSRRPYYAIQIIRAHTHRYPTFHITVTDPPISVPLLTAHYSQALPCTDPVPFTGKICLCFITCSPN